ncbi:MAG: hypothetical protein HDR05_00755 [Lachnospiraceae bacterium]|nr:hypothetical protein [Lachnospiraceae bacterium]
MFKVLDKLRVSNMYSVLVEGDTSLLENGLKLIDETGNVFEIETVGMTKYQNVDDYKKYANIVLCGDVENIGESLFLS